MYSKKCSENGIAIPFVINTTSFSLYERGEDGIIKMVYYDYYNSSVLVA